jgi:hypothetical protein
MSVAYYNLCKKLIDANRLNSLDEKISNLYLFEKLTNEEYTELMELYNEKVGGA